MLTPISVQFSSLNIITLAPMLITLAGALGILIIDLFKKDLDKTLYVILTVLILLVDFGAMTGLTLNARGFFNLVVVDGVAILGEMLIVVTSILFIPLALTSKRFHEYDYPEYFALFLFMIAGFQFMVATDNLILMFVGLETASLALYTMIAMHNTLGAHEAALKYFTMGAMAAGFFVMGSAMIYAVTGSVELYEIAKVLQERMGEPGLMVTIVGGAMMLTIAIGFKVSLFPFHTWTPDVYEGASAPMAGYMSIVPKIAMMVIAIRVLGMYIDLGVETVRNVVIALAVITMTLANMMALVQEDVKRMLAYSSISHAGFVMAAIALDTTKANSSIFLYYVLFLFTNLGAFTMLWISRHKDRTHHERFHHPYEKFAGMIHIEPVAAVIMAIFMLSLTGVPPFSLFWGKMYVMSATVDAGYIWLAIVMGLNSAIAAYYYLKLIIYMFLKEAPEGSVTIYTNRTRALEIVIGIAAFATIMSLFYVQPLMNYITYMISASGY
jgi:NADH-quinone oxidoreductase subunit N